MAISVSVKIRCTSEWRLGLLISRFPLCLHTICGNKPLQVGPKKVHNLLELAVLDWSNGLPDDRTALRAGFIAHNENIRKLVPSNNLLEFTPKNG
jgi:hypothetical protein